MSDPSLIDLVSDPDGLRRMFEAAPFDPDAPPARTPVIDVAEASPMPAVDCNVEIRLRVRFDPWQIDRIPESELRAIIWQCLTQPDYAGGIMPEITFVSMFIERTDLLERQRRALQNQPQRTSDPRHLGNVEDRGGGDGEPEPDGGDGE